jgi:hypothetical protein
MFLLPTIYFAFILVLIIKTNWFSVIKIPKIYLVAGFSLKVITGILLGLLYTYYYNPKDADTYHYFNDAKILFDSLKTNPLHYIKMLVGWDISNPEIASYLNKMNYWYSGWDSKLPNENHLIIRLHAFFMLFSFKNYWVHVIFFNVISFYAIQYFALFINKISGVKPLIPYFLLLVIPTVNIWSSGALKEPLYFLGLALVIYQLLLLNDFSDSNHNKKQYFLLALGFWLLWKTKFIILLLYLSAYFPYYIAKHFKVKIFYILAGMFTVGIYFILFTEPGLFLLRIISQKQHEFIELVNKTQAGSALYLPYLTTENPISFIKALPFALLNVFILPLPWQINKMVYLPYIVENIFFFTIWSYLIFRFKTIVKQSIPFAYTLIIFILGYGLLIGLTTPVLGAIVRYKSILTPLIIALLFYIVNPRVLPDKLKKLWLTN